MGKHIVTEAEKTVAELVDLALSGEPVTITRGGAVVAELQQAREVFRRPVSAADLEWMHARLETLPRVDVNVVGLVARMRDEDWS